MSPQKFGGHKNPKHRCRISFFRNRHSNKSKNPPPLKPGSFENLDELKTQVEKARKKAEQEYQNLQQEYEQNRSKLKSRRKVRTKQGRSQTQQGQLTATVTLKARSISAQRKAAPERRRNKPNRSLRPKFLGSRLTNSCSALGHLIRDFDRSLISATSRTLAKFGKQNKAQFYAYKYLKQYKQVLPRLWKTVHSWKDLRYRAKYGLGQLAHGALQLSLLMLNFILALIPRLFHSLHPFFQPSHLFRHYRRSFCHWRRMLFLRQCFYFSFSLACFSIFLASAYLFVASQEWQKKLESKLQGLFVLLEEQHGIQVRFQLQGLYLLHQIRLSDIQVRLQVPLQGIHEQNSAQQPRMRSIPPLRPAAPTQKPSKEPPRILARQQSLPAQNIQLSLGTVLDKLKSSDSFYPDMLRPLPASFWTQLGQLFPASALGQGRQDEAVRSKKATPVPSATQLYVQVDQLYIQFSLFDILRQSWLLLYETLSQGQDAQTFGALQLLQRLPQIEGTTAWQLFRLLRNIQKISLGQVKLELFRSELQVSSPVESSELNPSKTATKFPFSWQEFLQVLRPFPIEIQSLQLNFDFWQQLFEGQNIRFVLARQKLPPWHSDTAPSISLTSPTATYVPSWLRKIWQGLLGYSAISSQNAASSSALQRAQSLDRISKDSYLFDLQGKFRSRINSSRQQSDAPQLAFWGQLRASGGLSNNFDQAYLILDLQEFHSNYVSLRPILFQVKYLPEVLKLKALSKIRSLDWELQYQFAQQKLDLQLWANSFQLNDYLILAARDTDNAALVRVLQPFLNARFSGQSQVTLGLPRTLTERESKEVPSVSVAPLGQAPSLELPGSHGAGVPRPLELHYSGKMQAYLPKFDISLLFDGSGDLQGLEARMIRISQKHWEARFRGDLPYRSLLANGILDFEWQNTTPTENKEDSKQNALGYRGTYLLQRSNDDYQAENLEYMQGNTLIIDTVQSRFWGWNLPDEQDNSRYSFLTLGNQSPSQSQEIASGLAPWVQPQLRTFVFFQKGSYYISAQLRVPLSPEQMHKAEQSLNNKSKESISPPISLYKGATLYPTVQLQEYFRKGENQREPQTLPFPLLPDDAVAQSPLPNHSMPLPPFLPLEELGAEPNMLQQAEPDLGEASFYLVPLLSLYGNFSPKSTQSSLELNLNSLEWDEQEQSLQNGQIPLVVLLGDSLPASIEFLFPGLSSSYLELRSSLLSSSRDFQFWLEEFHLQGSENQQSLLVQGNVNPRQLNLEKMQLRWNELKADNQTLWDLENRSAQGILELQDQVLNYQFRQLLLPRTTPLSGLPDGQDLQKGLAVPQNAGGTPQYGWLLQGDYNLYAYFDSQNYQVAFEQLPLPQLPGLKQLLRSGTNDPQHNIGRGLLSLKVSGNYPNKQGNFSQRSWQVNLPLLRLELPEGGRYFPQGAELHFAGFWSPDQINFQQLVLLEPQRRLEGQGKLSFIRPETPILPPAQIAAKPSPSVTPPFPSNQPPPVSPTEPSPNTLQRGTTTKTTMENIFAQPSMSDSLALAPYAKAGQAKPQALPLPQKLAADLAIRPQDSQVDQGYWQGEFRLEGSLTEAGIRNGVTQIEGGESLQLNLSAEKQQFQVSADGQLDATRFTQLLDLLQGSRRQSLERGSLKFDIQSEGLYRRSSTQLLDAPKNQSRTLNFQLQFKELQGQWQLAQASYAGRKLEIGSQLLWRNSPALDSQSQAISWQANQTEVALPNNFSGQSNEHNALLLSNIKGQFGQLFLERSFLSYRQTNTAQQELAGLLRYSLQINQDKRYRSSISLNLKRRQTPLLPQTPAIWQNFSAIDQELLRWNGSFYSYPLRVYSQSTREVSQSEGSISAIASNLRQNVFTDNQVRNQNIHQVYPGFDIFLQPRILPAELIGTATSTEAQRPLAPPESAARETAEEASPQWISELYFYRRDPTDFEMGIRRRSFRINVGRAYPISFRAKGSSDGQNIDAQVEQLIIQPRLLNTLMPNDAILKQPILQFSQGQILGSLRLYGTVFDPAVDGSLVLQNIQLHSPYFPDSEPRINIQLVSEGHIIMAKPFQVPFLKGVLYSSGHEKAYLRHQNLQITRYYLGFFAEGKEGIPIFYDAYGIQYAAKAKGSAIMEGTDQAGYLNADFELNRLLMQGSSSYNRLERTPTKTDNPQRYPFSLDIRAKIGNSARLAYPQENSPIFTSLLNPRDELFVSFDGNNREGSIVGRVSLYNGELFLLGNQMNLRKGELVFNETFDNFSPDISLFFNLHTYDQQGQNIQINMDYRGSLANLAEQNWHPTLYSLPPLPEQQLRYLVSAQLSSGDGPIAQDLDSQQSQLISGVLSQLGSSVVLTPIEKLIRKEFKFDDVHLKTDLLSNLLNDYLGVNYRITGALYDPAGAGQRDTVLDSAISNWYKYLDNTGVSFGSYIDHNNTILLSFNIDLIYKPQDTSPVLFLRNGLQVVPSLGMKFSTPLIDISWNIGFAHYNDFFITDSSLLLEWSLSDFLNRKRLATLKRKEDDAANEIVPYGEE